MFVSALSSHSYGRRKRPPQSSRRGWRGWRRLLAVWLAALIASAGLVFGAATPSVAASFGVGYGDPSAFLGAYNVDGRQTYCLDFGVAPPIGNANSPKTVTSVDGLSKKGLLHG